MRGSVLVLLAACSGGTGIEAPREKPVLRLVECTPAQPLIVEVDGRVTSHARLDGEGMGWAGGGKPDRAPTRKAASISFGLPSTSGMMDAMIVRRAVSARIPDLQKCYDRELQLNPSTTRHSMAWRFSVHQDGHVVFADPTSRSLSAATSSCVSRIFRTLQFPKRTAGGSITVTLPIVFDSIPISERPTPLLVSGSNKIAWTPFAVGAFAPDRATQVARGAESVLRGQASKLDACFTAGTRGSLRTLLGVRADGTLAMIRAGGIGNDAIESCVEKALAGVKIVNLMSDPTEIACDFARGDAEPWRVTPSAGYGLIAATKKDMTFGQKSIVVGALEPDALPANATYLIVAEPDTPGSILSNALAWASEGDASLIALRDGNRAPMYLGMAGPIGHDDALSSRPMLVLGRGRVQACLGTQLREGKLSEAGQLAQRLATRCKAMQCGTLVVGFDDLALAKDLVEVTGAARRAGFDRVLIGAGVVCERAQELEDEGP